MINAEGVEIEVHPMCKVKIGSASLDNKAN